MCPTERNRRNHKKREYTQALTYYTQTCKTTVLNVLKELKKNTKKNQNKPWKQYINDIF